MDADRNLLFAALALHTGLIDSDQFTAPDRHVNSVFAGYVGHIGASELQANLRHDQYSDFGGANSYYLGYAYRQTGKLELAFRHYQRALQLNPRHRGAHEYAGEAYLITDDLAKAEEHLAALRQICLIPCEEYEDLKKAIAAYRRRTGR